MARRPRVALAFVAGVSLLTIVGLGLTRRHSALQSLAPLAAQLDSLEVLVTQDDEWLDRNARVMEGYAQHQEYARRITVRGRRAQAHALLVERYNEELARWRGTAEPRAHLPPLPTR